MFNLNESPPWNQVVSRRPRNPHDVEGTAYVGLPLATLLGGVTPFELQNLVVGIDGPPMIRSAHVRECRLIYLGDVLRAARSIAGSEPQWRGGGEAW